VLAPTGVYVHVGGSADRFLEAMVIGAWRSRKHGQRFRTFVKQPMPQNLQYVSELLAAGKLAPVIDRHYPLSEAAEAVRYLEQGHAQGNVIITVVPANN
jgi:NADPH:quinone reductase-like Zn-dependent oxidoreductase